MTQDERWENHYSQFLDFMTKHKHRPSKYHAEERPLLNWLKANKKQLAAGKMPAERIRKFETLQQLLKDYQRINQYAYVKLPEQLNIDFT